MAQNPAAVSAYMHHRLRIQKNNPSNGNSRYEQPLLSEFVAQNSSTGSLNIKQSSSSPSTGGGGMITDLINDFRNLSTINSKHQPSRGLPGSSGYPIVPHEIDARDSTMSNRGNLVSPIHSSPRIPEDPIYANLGKVPVNRPPQYSPPAPPPYEAFHNKITGVIGTSANYQHPPTGTSSVASSRSSPSLYSGSITLNKSLYSNGLENESDCPIYENLDTLQQSHDIRNGCKSTAGHLDSQYIYAPLSDVGSSISLPNSNNSKTRACPQVPVKKPTPSSVGRVVAHSEMVLNRGHSYAEIPVANQFKPIHTNSGGTSSPSPYAVTNVMPNRNTQTATTSLKTSPQKQQLPAQHSKTFEASKAGQQIKGQGRKLLPSMTLHKANGPTEAELKLEELTRRLEEEMEEQEAYFGICYGCQQKVIGQGQACQAMGNLYHTSCFTCVSCGRALRGKAFYNVNNKVFCEEDYLYSGFQQTAERCVVCGHLIMETILQAMGRPYHPGCFRCCVCNLNLDGIPFTIDMDNKIYCLEHYHEIFAPVCAACGKSITPIEGTQETVRVVSMEKDFHVDCYSCEDCGIQLTDEPDKRCYPLDDKLMCKPCHMNHLLLKSLSATQRLEGVSAAYHYLS